MFAIINQTKIESDFACVHIDLGDGFMQGVEHQSKNILLFSVFVAILLIFTMLYQSSNILLVEGVSDMKDKTRVAILTSDKVIDQSWGSLAYKGQLEIEGAFPVKATLHTELKTDASKKQSASKMIDEGADVIIGHGREFSETFTSLAENHTNVMFVTIHGSSTYDNQAVYTFEQGEVEYFAALAATLKSETKKIGVIDSDDEREIDLQFEEGLQYYDSEVNFYYDVVHNRDDGDQAIEVMKNMMANGVDVIYSKGNAYNQRVIEYAKIKDIYVIGYIDDQSYMARNNVLTSVINDVPQAYVAIMNDYFSEEGIPSGTTMLTDRDDVYKLAPCGPMFTTEEKNYIKSEMEKYNQGEITF